MHKRPPAAGWPGRWRAVASPVPVDLGGCWLQRAVAGRPAAPHPIEPAAAGAATPPLPREPSR